MPYLTLAAVVIIIYFIGFNFAPTQYRSYGDFSALLVEEGLRFTFVHDFRHKWAPE
jgi:hypothetical protein